MGEEGNKTTREVQMPPLSGSRDVSENAAMSWAPHLCPDPPALLLGADSPFLAVLPNSLTLAHFLGYSLIAIDSFSIN